MANGLSNDKSGLNPFWKPGCCEYTVSYLSSSHRSNDTHCILERSHKELILEGYLLHGSSLSLICGLR